MDGEPGPDDVCTVDDVAERLHLHPKTVLRYIRDGRLRATRIGKSYRILRRDLDAFAGVPAPPRRSVRVSAVVDIPDVDAELARTWARAVGAALESRPPGVAPLHAEVIHDPEARHVKVVIVAGPDDTVALLDLVRVWTRQLTT